MKNVYSKKRRLWEIDFFRGIAVTMMIIFHVFWSLDYFNILNIKINSIYWKILARSTAIIFFLIVGISLILSYSKINHFKTNYLKKYFKRGLKILGYGFIITLISYFLLKEGFVLFGVLHFIGIGIIVSAFFLKMNKEILALVGIFAIGIGLYIKNIFVKVPYLFWIGFKQANFYAIDYFPIFPWIGFILIGMYMGKKLFPNGKRKIKISQKPKKILKFFCFLGRNSLIIYFLHMIVILAAVHIILYI